MPQKKYQNPKGGLNQAGRNYYKRTEGANLQAPVKGTPDSPAEMRRKGSFLVRMGSAKGALTDDKGEPTRLKQSLVAWGHNGDKASAVARGRRLLERYKKRKEQA